jgi:acyl-CoA synthetase (AMP-forming)/AMP-acid ligase II
MEEVEKLPYSSIAGALQYQSEIRPNKLALLYPDPNENFTKYASLTYEEYNNITNHLAAQIFNSFPSFSSDERITCALLAVGGIEYLLSQYALLKLPNVIMFPISTRNSQSAIEHLLKETQTTILLTTSQFYPMIKTIQQQQQSQFQSLKVLLLDSEQFQMKELLKYKDKKSSTTSNIIQSKKTNNEELNKVVVILHRYIFCFCFFFYFINF